MATAIVFQRLSQTTTIYEPPQSSTSPDNAPTTILIVGWMGSTNRNLSRYAMKYNALYPAARLVVVTSALSDTAGFRALLSRKELIQRAEVPVRALLADTKSGNGRLLIHVFSNGGGFNLANMSKTYEGIAGVPLPACAVIFDSLPGGDKFTNEFGRWVNAIAFALPSNPVIRWPGRVLVALMVIALFGIPSVFGVENGATKARRELNDEKFLNAKAKRLYLYSEADALIGAKEVREYAVESAAKGWDVETIDFRTSGHVRHAIVFPERYWEAVVQTWKSSV